MAFKVISNKEKVKKLSNQAILFCLTEIGLKLEKYAKQECPVKTNRLRGSITNEVLENMNTVIVGTNVEYAPYVELGARGRPPKHFIANSINNHSDEYKNIIERELKR